MKKKIILIGMVVLLLVFLSSSCKKVRYAYITIFNEGEILITAMVDDDASLISPGEGVEWTISWEGSRTTQVYLYAEPVGFNDSDEEWVTVGNGDDYTWETGWVYLSGAGLKKSGSDQNF
jgi:hypothetical protein